MATRAMLNPDIFRAYDIRGIVGPGFNAEGVRLIGQAIGSEAIAAGERTLFCAADARLSSPALAATLREGLYNSGVHVIDLGVVPTPLLYFATHTQEFGSGVMLTGSHNPRDYNGLKIVLNKHTLADNQIQRIRERIDNNELAHGKGWHSRFDIAPLYLQAVTERIHLQRRYKVVVDGGNGVGGLVATTLFRQLGCDVIPLFCEPDGNFPNHHPDPTRAENLVQLQAAIALHGADLGIALDGDADRLGIVTASGHVLSADHLLLAFAMDILPDNPGASVVFDVKSSHHLPKFITAYGGKPIMCKSGHSFVKQKIYETDALLGGEFSAHIFFKHRWFGFDDGIYAAARFLELMDKYQASADTLLAKMPTSFSTPELFAPIAEEDKFAVMATLKSQLHFADSTLELLDGVRVDFADGWALIRASNTTANLVLRFEADTAAALARIQQQFRSAVLAIVPTLALPF
jgi:phosphomannomutase / phosphoglucomutase